MDAHMPDEVSAELERLAEEQIIDLDADAEDRVRRGRQRRARVATLYAQGKLQSSRDFYHASLIMLYGEEPAHWELARLLARRAAIWAIRAHGRSSLLHGIDRCWRAVNRSASVRNSSAKTGAGRSGAWIRTSLMRSAPSMACRRFGCNARRLSNCNAVKKIGDTLSDAARWLRPSQRAPVAPRTAAASRQRATPAATAPQRACIPALPPQRHIPIAMTVRQRQSPDMSSADLDEARPHMLLHEPGQHRR